VALPDFQKLSLGTPIIWGEAGATGISLTVTNTLSVDGLASAAARQGASADLGSTWDADYLLQQFVEVGTAPSAGTTVECYLAWSHDNVNWPSAVTGGDGAYPNLTGATVATAKLTLGLPGNVLVADGGTGTNRVQSSNPTVVRAKARYVTVVQVNLLGQAFRDETTATNNDSRVVFTPIRTSIVD
jgi:hypothetical protein